MERKQNLVGKTYGRLTVISFSGMKSGTSKATYNCICECGRCKIILATVLQQGTTLSCGCLRLERVIAANTIHGQTAFEGKRKKSPEYTAWSKMKSRCYAIKEKCYVNYGGRGIAVCEKWLNSFENFLEDMGQKPSPKHSLDRIKNELGYFKENCRWATKLEQANNNRRNVFVEYKGVRKTIKEWSRELNISYFVIQTRLKNGYSAEAAFEIPPGELIENRKKFGFVGNFKNNFAKKNAQSRLLAL